MVDHLRASRRHRLWIGGGALDPGRPSLQGARPECEPNCDERVCSVRVCAGGGHAAVRGVISRPDLAPAGPGQRIVLRLYPEFQYRRLALLTSRRGVVRRFAARRQRRCWSAA